MIPFVLYSEINYGKSFLFGWFCNQINTNVNGYRPNKLKPFVAFSSFQSNMNVIRISTDVFTKGRLENRTSGSYDENEEKSFLVAGTGSIGSNLIYFLNTFNFPEFRLIDGDIVCLENIQRHLLGFEYIGIHKTKALKDYILKKNPLQKVSTREMSVVDIVTNETDFINEVDYVFISIGKTNIDNWIGHTVKEKKIIKPVFFIWVEPYLFGGHCIYLHPSNPVFEEYFEEGYFKFNVINSDEYKTGNKKLSLREAGCQSTFIPYSNMNVIYFISSLFPYISSIINFNKESSTSFSWVGNLEMMKRLNIRSSNYYSSQNVGTIIEHII